MSAHIWKSDYETQPPIFRCVHCGCIKHFNEQIGKVTFSIKNFDTLNSTSEPTCTRNSYFKSMDITSEIYKKTQ